MAAPCARNFQAAGRRLLRPLQSKMPAQSGSSVSSKIREAHRIRMSFSACEPFACSLLQRAVPVKSCNSKGHGVQRSAASQSDVKRREATGQAPMYMLANSAEGTRVHAALAIAEGTQIMATLGQVLRQPTMHTIQFSETEHIDCKTDIRFTSHSCNPNCRMLVQRLPDGSFQVSLVAMRRIEVGNVLSFDYCTTEWNMQSPFDCICTDPTPLCRGQIQGYRYLNDQQRDLLGDTALSSYILERRKKTEV